MKSWALTSRELEIRFDGYLADPWIARGRYLAKGIGVDVAQRILELGVVEDVEELRSELGSIRSLIFVTLWRETSKSFKPGPPKNP